MRWRWRWRCARGLQLRTRVRGQSGSESARRPRVVRLQAATQPATPIGDAVCRQTSFHITATRSEYALLVTDIDIERRFVNTPCPNPTVVHSCIPQSGDSSTILVDGHRFHTVRRLVYLESKPWSSNLMSRGRCQEADGLLAIKDPTTKPLPNDSTPQAMGRPHPTRGVWIQRHETKANKGHHSQPTWDIHQHSQTTSKPRREEG